MKNIKKVIVVGNGGIGETILNKLEEENKDVIIVDDLSSLVEKERGLTINKIIEKENSISIRNYRIDPPEISLLENNGSISENKKSSRNIKRENNKKKKVKNKKFYNK